MKILNKEIPIDFSNRKYLMLLWELCLFILLLAMTQAINILFPTEGEVVRQGNYTLYILFAFGELLILAAMGFIAGVWVTSWRYDKTHAYA